MMMLHSNESHFSSSDYLMKIYSRLHERYGAQYWWPAEGPFEVVIGAILTQGTSWHGANKALLNLKSKGVLNPVALNGIDMMELASLIRPSVYYRAKADKISSFLQYLWENYDGNLQRMLDRQIHDLREELLSIYGIGEETADDIILYAAGKPIFVVDTYTKRILARVGVGPCSGTYKHLQQWLMENLPRDVDLFNDYHALLDQHGSTTCLKNAPDCAGCCLRDICDVGSQYERHMRA